MPLTVPNVRRYLLLGLAAIIAAGDVSAAPARYALRGDLLTPNGVIANGTLIINEGRIETVSAAEAPAGVPVTDTHGLICPGLIDLHNHLTWNVFPRWSSGRKFPNRYEWQQLPEYLMALAGPHATLIARGQGPAMARYAEVKAVAGGATSLAGLYPEDLGPGFRGSYHGLMRMLDIGSGFYPDGTPEPVRYHVFPLVLSETEASELRSGLTSGRIRSLLIHLGEGAPRDASSMLEYQILKARGLLLKGVSLIHGVALHREEFEEMARLGVGLVWSPRSNFELYAATADVGAAKRAGVTIAIAPDWSPTGSDGLIQELAYASTWNASQPQPVFSDSELAAMATLNAAVLAGTQDKIGSLSPGHLADLLVVRREARDPVGSLVHGDPSDILLVVINGQPVYGERPLAKALSPGAAWTGVRVAATTKVVCLPDGPSGSDWASLCAGLDRELKRTGTHLGSLAGD